MARQDRRHEVAGAGPTSVSRPARGCPAVLWGVAFAILVRGLPVDADGHVHLSISDVLNAYTLLGGLATAGLFLLYGAVFVALKTSGAIRDDAHRFAVWLSLPVTGLVAAFGLWTQLAHGKDWTWVVLGVAVVAQLAAVVLVWRRASDGWAFACTAAGGRGRGDSVVRRRCTRTWCRRR